MYESTHSEIGQDAVSCTYKSVTFGYYPNKIKYRSVSTTLSMVPAKSK
jgi:hypothetical protein